MNAIGSAIRKLREDRGMSLRELSERLIAAGHPLSHAALGYKERGGAAISPRDRKFIAQALGMSLDEFDREWRADRIERTDDDESGRKGIPVINRAPAGRVQVFDVSLRESLRALGTCPVTCSTVSAFVW